METQGARPVVLTGGCQCGAIRYRLDAEADGAALCHCRMCQKASGGPLMAFAGVPREAFAITRGAVATFRSSDVVERGFCAACGTPLTYRILASQRIAFTLGSLDNPGAIAPQTQFGDESRVAWLTAALAEPDASLSDWLKSKHLASVGSRQHPDHDT